MANIESLTFTKTPLNTLGALPLTSYSGALNVNYDTGAVTGNLLVAPALGISLTRYTNFTLTRGVGNTYTITGTGQTATLVNSTIFIQYTGDAPTSVSTQYYAAGLELASGTNGAVTSAAVCFAAGTLIRTEHGDVPVENLQVGDLVRTSAGELRPITWLGHRTVDCARHPRPKEVLPVRIAAGAFGEKRPARDLWVSPGHSICVDVVGEILIPACTLVNGTTIQQVDVETIDYWHVELETQDILLAENMPAESYLEMGNRGFFVESDVVAMHLRPDAEATTYDDFCRPYVNAGPILDAVRSSLRTRAQAIGWFLEQDPSGDMHLMVDGKRIDPISRGLDYRFAVPLGSKEIRLMSSTSKPVDIGLGIDTRDLGVQIAALMIEETGGRHVIEIGDELLQEGFYAVEDARLRWTSGSAYLPSKLWQECKDGFDLRVKLAAPALPRWRRRMPATLGKRFDEVCSRRHFSGPSRGWRAADS